MRPSTPIRARASLRGVTLLELLFATVLAVIVLGAVMTVTQNALRIWTKAETVRDAREVATVALGTLATDLRQVHPIAEGDLLVDWQPFDLERDGSVERVWPRIRMVRDISGAERDGIERRAAAAQARLARGSRVGPDGEPLPQVLADEEMLQARGLTTSELSGGALGAERDAWGGALAEVLLAVLPEGVEGTDRTTGVLVRAERLHVPGTPHRWMDEGAFLGSGAPIPEIAAEELVGGVLWLEPLMASQTSVILGENAWRISDDVSSASTSWDAWRRGRPDLDVSGRNEPAPGIAPAGPRPRLPRALRLSIEVIRPQDRRRAPKLVDGAGAEETSIVCSTTRRLRGVVGSHVLVGSEWMLVRSVSGDRLSVKRGQRDTRARNHPSGTPILLGQAASIEVPIALHADDWVSDGRGEGLR